MDPQQLLNLPKPIDELTDAELEAHLSRFFPHTRPKKPMTFLEARLSEDKPAPPTGTSAFDKMAAAMAAVGLDPAGRPLPKATTSKAALLKPK